jgi:cytochrome c551/c552
MKRAAVVIGAGIATALFQAAAYSEDRVEALAKQAGCLNCHAADAKKAGPSLKDISAKGKAADADKVVKNVKAKPVHGASVKKMKDDELKAVVSWMLSR